MSNYVNKPWIFIIIQHPISFLARRITQTCCAAIAGVMGARVPDAQPCSRMAALLVADVQRMHTSCLVLALPTAAVPAHTTRQSLPLHQLQQHAALNRPLHVSVHGDVCNRPLAGLCRPECTTAFASGIRSPSGSHHNRSHRLVLTESCKL